MVALRWRCPAPGAIFLARPRRVAIDRWITARIAGIGRDAGRDHAVGVRDRGAVQRQQRGAEHLQRAVRQALGDPLFGAAVSIAAVSQEASALVASGTGVGAGGVLVAVVLIAMADKGRIYCLFARVACPTLCALAFIRVRLVIAGSTVLARCRSALIGRITCPLDGNTQTDPGRLDHLYIAG